MNVVIWWKKYILMTHIFAILDISFKNHSHMHFYCTYITQCTKMRILIQKKKKKLGEKLLCRIYQNHIFISKWIWGYEVLRSGYDRYLYFFKTISLFYCCKKYNTSKTKPKIFSLPSYFTWIINNNHWCQSLLINKIRYPKFIFK